MNTPWSEGIGNRGPLLPYGGGQKEWEYQVSSVFPILFVFGQADVGSWHPHGFGWNLKCIVADENTGI
jgi:hypothetical protein